MKQIVLVVAFFLSLYRVDTHERVMLFGHPYESYKTCMSKAQAVVNPGVTYAVCR